MTIDEPFIVDDIIVIYSSRPAQMDWEKVVRYIIPIFTSFAQNNAG